MPTNWIVPKHFQDKKDLLWIVFKEKELLSQNSYARGNSTLSTKETGNTWTFLAPTEFMENVMHSWGEYESITTRLAEKGISIIKGLEDIDAAIGGAVGAFNEARSKNTDGGSLTGVVSSGINESMKSSQVMPVKVDAAYTYQTTNRREYTFTFNLALIPSENSSGKDVYLPVHELKKSSCASVTDNMIQFGFPNIFEIYTYPGELLYIKNAAIQSVQPTWYSPFIDGYPSKCELMVTVTDIEPLYRQTWENTSIVRTEVI